jgi:hypothetical protein
MKLPLITIITVALLSTLVHLHPVYADNSYLDRPLEFELLDNGNLLVTDGGGSDWTTTDSQVFIFNRDGQIQWQSDRDLKFAHSAHQLSDGSIVITDTANDRLITVNPQTNALVWSSDDWSSGTGQLSDGSHLDYPNQAIELANHHLLVTDRNHNRIIEIDSTGKISWQYSQLNRPHNASQIPNGNYLVSDSDNNRVLIIDPAGQIVWQYSGGDTPLDWPRDVKLLENGNYLITDTRHHRVLEVTPDKQSVWEFNQDLYWPYAADRLSNGNTLISDSQNRRLIEVAPDHQLVWELKHPPLNHFADFSNGNFEHADHQLPQSWIPADLLSEGYGQFSLDSSIFHTGNAAGKISSAGPGFTFWTQIVPLKPDRQYQFSGWLKTSLDSDPNSWSRFELWWATGYGGYIDPPLISEKSFASADWTRRDWTGTAPDGATAVEIRALTTGTGDTWFDDISWKPSTSSFDKFKYPALGFLAIIATFLILPRLLKLLRLP